MHLIYLHTSPPPLLNNIAKKASGSHDNLHLCLVAVWDPEGATIAWDDVLGILQDCDPALLVGIRIHTAAYPDVRIL